MSPAVLDFFKLVGIMAIDNRCTVSAFEFFQKFEAAEPVTLAPEQSCSQWYFVGVVLGLVDFIARKNHSCIVKMNH